MIRDIVRKVRRLLIYTRNCRGELCFGVLFMALEHLISIWMIASLLGNCVHAIQQGLLEGSVSHGFSLLWKAVLLALPWLAASIALNAASRYLIGIASARAAAAMRSHLLDILLNSSLAASHSSHSGLKLSYFTNDINAAFDSLISTLSVPVGAALTGVVCLVYVLKVHWALAIVALGIGILTCLYSVIFAKWLHRIAQKMQALMAVLESRMKDILDGMVVSRIYGMKEKLEAGMGAASEELCKEGILWARVSGGLGALNNGASYFSERILIFAAGLFVLKGMLSLPELMRVTEMAGGVIGVFHVSRMLVAVQRSMAGAERVFDVMDSTAPEASGSCDAVPVNNAVPAIAFSKVSFSYNPVQPVIKELSFEAANGEMVALTGPSGSGKSTVLALAQGLYLPVEGSVSFMGVPVNEWNIAALRKLLSLAPQTPVLFPGTIGMNIAIGDKNPSQNRIQWAAEQAFAHDFIMAMPEGYDTQVAERGASLSGGQRQRIAIARALYHDAPVLLLDEATSAMDMESEAAVHNTLSSLKGKKTILCVTHREAAVRMADQVLVIS